MAYVGTPIDTTNQFQSLQGKRFNGDGSTTAFTLDIAPNSVFDIEVFVENVRQDPNSAYTLNGTTLTFSAAPPSGTNNIYVVHQAKAVGTIAAPVGGSIDMNGVELILDEDGDTSITADTDDQIDFKTGGTDRVVIASNGDVGIGTTSPNKDSITKALTINSPVDTNYSGLELSTADTLRTALISNSNGGFLYTATNIPLIFQTNNSERMRIDTSGHLLVGKTSLSLDVDGVLLDPNGISTFTANSSDVLYINRRTNDGTLVGFYQDGTGEGYIGVSGSTVSYNGFTGTHWSRLSDNSKPTILKGTILESLDEMCDWYQVQFDVTDDEGNTATQKENYALGDGESVGDVITYNFEGTDYQATIIQEGDIKHTKSKISDTADAKNVYGVFMDWDNDDDTVNDMLIAQTGTFVVRLNSSVTTLNKGDLIQSNGDGTGKVQADDIIRASTVAKVLSTTKIETYSDGSYIVPCSLHC